MIRAIWAALACAVLTGCVTTTPLEPQGRSLSANNARIYLIRPDSWVGKLAVYSVEIDGKNVGRVANASYLSVDRPPGRHEIVVAPLLDFAGARHEFHAEAGRSYYFAINAKSSTTAVVSGSFVMAIPLPGTSAGKPIEQRNVLSGIYFGALDDAEGRAMIAALKKP
jgi:hypothetical protein